MERQLATRIARGIALAGVAAGAILYAVAEPPEAPPLGYDVLTNKKYVHELQQYGGRANVASAEFMEWLESRWHGRSLGVTVAVLSVAGAAAFWWWATLPPADDEGAPAN